MCAHTCAHIHANLYVCTYIYTHTYTKVIIYIVVYLLVVFLCVYILYLVNFSSSFPSNYINLNATPLFPVTHINYLVYFLPYIFPCTCIDPCTYNCKDISIFFPIFFSSYYTIASFLSLGFSHSIMPHESFSIQLKQP